MTCVSRQLSGEVHQRGPGPMKRLQYDGVAAREQRSDFVVPHLVSDLRAGASWYLPPVST